MNHSVAIVDETFIITPSTLSARNKVPTNRGLLNEQKQIDYDTSSRSTQQTVEQSFETISRISAPNAHQLSLSLKISIQEEGDFVLKNTTSNHSCPNDKEASPLAIDHQIDNGSPSSNRLLAESSTANELISHERSSRSQDDLPDIINNVMHNESHKYRNPTHDSELIVGVVQSNSQNESKSVLILPDHASSGSHTNLDLEESSNDTYMVCNIEQTHINHNGIEKSHPSDRISFEDRTEEHKIKTSSIKMEPDAGLSEGKLTELSCDQSNSDSGLGYNLNTSNASMEKSNKHTLSPSCNSANSSMISTSDSNQHDTKEYVPNDECTTKNLKSLLKEPGHRVKHNRRVTFDQTVIVFCEELDPTFVSTESGNSYDPPIEYNNSRPFDPPDDYRDDDATSSEEELDARDYDDVFERNNNGPTCYDLDIETEQRLKNIIMAGRNVMGDDQLLGMLKEDALLQAISMTVDELSEEDFPIHFNSHQTNSLDEHVSDGEVEANKINKETKDMSKTFKETASANQQLGNQTAKEFKVVSEKADCFMISDGSTVKKSLSDEKQASQATEVTINQTINNREQESSKHQIAIDDQHTDEAQNQYDELKDDRNLDNGEKYTHQSSQEVPCADSKSIYEDGKLRRKNDLLTNRQSVTIRQAVVDPVAVSRAIIPHNQELVRTQTERCKQCEKNTTNIPSVCQDQSCSQNLRQNVCNPYNNNATIIKISQKTTNSHPEIPTRISIDTNCSNNQGGIATTISPQFNEQKNTCHVCRNIVSETNTAISNNITFNHSLMKNNAIYTQSNYEQKNLQISKQIGLARPQNLRASNTNQNYVIQPPPARPCCEAARKYQTIGLPAPTAPIKEICLPTARQLVYFVDQYGSTIGTGTIPIPKTNSLNSQLGNDVSVIKPNNCNKPNHLNLTYQGGPRLPVGTTIYCNDANCPLLKNTTKKLYNPTMELASCGVQETTQPGYTSKPYPIDNNLQNEDKANSLARRPGHMVYYIQHPLEKPAIKSCGQTSNLNLNKSQFPNAHEIRRLDGLNAPPLTQNASMIASQKHNTSEVDELETFVMQDQRRLDKIRKRYSLSSNDELVDPTFGFSKRPSVKVISKIVATKQASDRDNHAKERQIINHQTVDSCKSETSTLRSIQNKLSAHQIRKT